MQKKYSVLFIIIMFLLSFLFCVPHDKTERVLKVVSPVEIVLDSKTVLVKDFECFDSYYSLKNKELARKLNITESEAFVIGNLGKYWSSNILVGRNVYLRKGGDLTFLKRSYKTKLKNSGYCFVDSKPVDRDKFDKILKHVRFGKYKVLDVENSVIYDVNDKAVKELTDFLVLRDIHIPKQIKKVNSDKSKVKNVFDKGSVKIIYSDLTNKILPDRNCSTQICKEIVDNINKSQNSIDMAIYGYSQVNMIESALDSALKRGVNIRLVYDSDKNGNNIYPNTDVIVKKLVQNKNDFLSDEVDKIMHNKFYIFDNKTVITGSANLSHTDMSGFNSNCIVVIDSKEVANIYKQEFEQMYLGKFHSTKNVVPKSKIIIGDTELQIAFSPKDKAIANIVLPLIKNAKSYIYIPTFVLTESRVTEELINAKNRGVDVRIIIDALNASVKHSKHNQLRLGKVLVKTENYAGMHSKSMIVDDEYTIVGSMNFSNSGENRNDENMILIKDSQITKHYKNFFLYQWNRIDDKWLKLNAKAEGFDSLGSCFDGIDNDYDGMVDNVDPACKK